MAQAATSPAPVHQDVTERGASLIWITVAVLAATLMQTLDTTIVNVALPVIQGNVGARSMKAPGLSPATSCRPSSSSR